MLTPTFPKKRTSIWLRAVYFVFGWVIHLAALSGKTVLTFRQLLWVSALGGLFFLIALSMEEGQVRSIPSWPRVVLRGALVGIRASAATMFSFNLVFSFWSEFISSHPLFHGITKLEGYITSVRELFWIALIPFGSGLPLMAMAGALALLSVRLLALGFVNASVVPASEIDLPAQPPKFKRSRRALAVAMFWGAFLHFLIFRAFVAWTTMSSADAAFFRNPITYSVFTFLGGICSGWAFASVTKGSSAWPWIREARKAAIASLAVFEVFALCGSEVQGFPAIWIFGAVISAFLYWLAFAPVVFVSGALLSKALSFEAKSTD